MMPFKKYFLILAAFLSVSIPSVTFADTVSQQQERANLSAQLTQIQNELSSGTVTTSTTFTLSPGQSIQEATTSSSTGLLTITLPKFLHTNPDPTIPPIIPQTITQFAEITLEFDPCIAAAPSVCVTQALSSYPVMTSILKEGQDTGYLHYLITLTSLSSTTATFSITDTSNPFLTSIQNQVNAIAAEVRALTNN